MIKRIIFDLDNTIIMWKDEYLNAIRETIKEYNIKENYKYISSIIDDYDDNFDHYDKNLLINFINERINDKIDIEFINTFLNKFGYMSDISNSTIETLKYLSNKYELVVLTNWFKKPQEARLKNANIDKYFIKVYGGEKYTKPSKEAFLNACSNHKPSECLMIGDDYKKDIEGADILGLKVIYFNYKNKDNPNNYHEIKKIEELERIL